MHVPTTTCTCGENDTSDSILLFVVSRYVALISTVQAARLEYTGVATLQFVLHKHDKHLNGISCCCDDSMLWLENEWWLPVWHIIMQYIQAEKHKSV